MGDGSDSSDEEFLALCLLYRRARKRNCSKRSIWCRDHYLLRPERGEFTRTFRYLMDNPDRELFFNYTRMSYETYTELVLPHLQPIGTNYREAISGEEKLILTLRKVPERVHPYRSTTSNKQPETRSMSANQLCNREDNANYTRCMFQATYLPYKRKGVEYTICPEWHSEDFDDFKREKRRNARLIRNWVG